MDPLSPEFAQSIERQLRATGAVKRRHAAEEAKLQAEAEGLRSHLSSVQEALGGRPASAHNRRALILHDALQRLLVEKRQLQVARRAATTLGPLQEAQLRAKLDAVEAKIARGKGELRALAT